MQSHLSLSSSAATAARLVAIMALGRLIPSKLYILRWELLAGLARALSPLKVLTRLTTDKTQPGRRNNGENLTTHDQGSNRGASPCTFKVTLGGLVQESDDGQCGQGEAKIGIDSGGVEVPPLIQGSHE
jgi:hypothetical protein